MAVVSYRDGVAIGELIVYFPALAIAILLTVRHGFGRNSGWIFLIIFTLVRIIGACFQLATINNPTNVNLYIGTAILGTIGLSPLELCALGLLSRVISSINKSYTTLIKPHQMKFAQLIVTVGFILGIVGGINSGESFGTTGRLTPQSLNKAAMGLFIASYVIIVAATIITSFSVSHAELGEKRLLLAVALSLPFLLVRLIYSAISIFGSNTSDFNSLTGSVTILLCMGLIMELCAVVIYETMGLTLKRLAPIQTAMPLGEDVNGIPQSQPSKGSQFVSTLGRRTIIGRLIMKASGKGDDVEMQGTRGYGSRKTRRAARRDERARG